MAAILKIKNHDISATVWLMFTKFGKMMQKRVSYLPQPFKYMNFKNIRLLNRNVQLILMKFGMETKPPQKSTPFSRVHVVWAIKHENLSTGLTCRQVPKKGINK